MQVEKRELTQAQSDAISRLCKSGDSPLRDGVLFYIEQVEVYAEVLDRVASQLLSVEEYSDLWALIRNARDGYWDVIDND